MPSLFHCPECDEWYPEEELSPDGDDWLCINCLPEACDCGSYKCSECGPRMSESESDLVDARKDGDV